MPKLLREPLVHFVLIGALLFASHHIWARWFNQQDYTIFVSEAEILRQAEIYASENQRQPTEEDIQGLIFAHVEEQVLMREARRLGLEDDDTIIRRRLAQKMRFMINEDKPPTLPSDAKLKSWFEDNKDRFTRLEQRAFTHVYFSPGQHDDVEKSAQSALKIINDNNWKQIGDPFIESNHVQDTDRTGLTRRYGNNFSNKLFALPVSNDWQGPISSAFGVHLVRIDNHSRQESPGFDDARPEIEKLWQEQALRDANEQRLVDLLEKYKVKVEGLDP